MEGHNYNDAWNDKEFNKLFDMYEEDSCSEEEYEDEEIVSVASQ